MDALLTGLVMFGFWLVVGYAVTSRCLPRKQAVPNLLLAPVVGMTITEVTLFTCLRLGYPIGPVALPVSLGLFFVALCSLLVSRAPVPVRRYAPFAAIFIAAYLLNGWPQLRFGHDWVGYASVDMSNYCMTAECFTDHALEWTEHDNAELSQGRDHTQMYRKWYLVANCRLGADLSLSALSCLTGRTPAAVCTSFVLAMHMALVSVTGFLAHRYRRGRLVALAACLFMAVSAPSTFGILDQMLGQVGGLALLAGAVGLACRPAYRLPVVGLLRRGLLGSILVAGLLIHYPEVTPFLGVTYVVVSGLALLRRQFDYRRLIVGVIAGVLGVALLGNFGLAGIQFLYGQLEYGGSDAGDKLHFHHAVFNTPHGILLFWGERTRVNTLLATSDPGGFWSWFQIVIGAVAMLAFSATAVVMARKRPVWATVIVMATLTILLFSKGAWFGVHKMVMYFQPFLAVALGMAAFTTRRLVLRIPAAMFLIAVLGSNAVSQYEYTQNSTKDSGRCPFPAISRTGFITELQNEVKSHPAERVLVAVEDPFLARFLIVPLRGKETALTSLRDLLPETHRSWTWGGKWYDELPRPQLGWDAPPEVRERIESDAMWGEWPAWVMNPGPNDYLLSPGHNLAVINRSRYRNEKSENFLIQPLRDVRNHLMLRESRQSVHLIGFPQAPFDPNANFAYHGSFVDHTYPDRERMAYLHHHLTFQVINPSPKLRLVLASASSHLKSWDGQLPSITVTGKSSVKFGQVGHGSGRVISPPFEAAIENNWRTLRVDLTRENWQPSPPQIAGIPASKMVCICRDLSLVTEEEYLSYQPPQSLSNFPADLNEPLLEYSGLNELGWASEAFTARLSRPAGAQSLEIRGTVPQIKGPGFQTDLTVLIDGVEVARRTLSCGDFTIHTPVSGSAGPRWVECRFSNVQQWLPPDFRSVSAQLKFIGFVPTDPTQTRPPESVTAFPEGLKNPLLSATGIHTDGWVEKDFKLRLTQATKGQLTVIRGIIPQVSSGGTAFQTEMTVLLDGAEMVRKTLGCGEFEVRVPAGEAAGARVVECRFTNDQTLPPPDGRRAVAHLKFIGFEPARSGE